MREFDPLTFAVIFDELLGRVGLLAAVALGLIILVAGAIGLRRLYRADRLWRGLRLPMAIGLVVGIIGAIVLPAMTGGMIARAHGVDFVVLALFATGVAGAAVVAAAAVTGCRRYNAKN